MSLFKLKGVIQNYLWGGKEFIPEMLGAPVTDQPVAEYWMGAHEKSPSVEMESGKNLSDLINDNPVNLLGQDVYDRFGRLPFLFKVLDVQDMLSIQVHPTKKEAEKGFAYENQMGIPLDKSSRNYKDDNHKPEIMVALSEFWLLHGFRLEHSLIEILEQVPELNHLVSVFKAGSYKGLYKHVMLEPQIETDAILNQLRSRLLSSYQNWDKTRPEYWALEAFDSFCDDKTMDKGIYSIFFFNIVKANPGEAIFQDAGIPHAYLKGQNMELMANSDNVLRGGLTPKHVDVDELLKHVKFVSTHPKILKGELSKDGIEQVYKSPAPDFELSALNILEENKYQFNSMSFEIFLVLSGTVQFKCDENSLVADSGNVVAVSANTSYSIVAKENSQLYKAKCPIE